MAGSRWGDAGGIIGLAEALRDHGGAINYDLMTMLGTTVDAVPSVISWRDLRDFISHLPPGSATLTEIHPEMSPWGQQAHAEMMLADIYDVCSALLYAFSTAHSKSKPQKPKPYPRPYAEKADEDRLGSGAIPVRDFDAWWESFDGKGGDGQ